MKRIGGLLLLAFGGIVLAATFAGCRSAHPKQLPDTLSSYLPYDVDDAKIHGLIRDKSVDAVPPQNLLDAHREFALMFRQRNRGESRRSRAHHQGGIEDVVVEREVTTRDDIHPCLRRTDNVFATDAMGRGIDVCDARPP